MYYTENDFLKNPLWAWIVKSKPAQISLVWNIDNYYDFEIKGFKVIDSKHGEIGTVIGVIDSKVNPLLEIENGDLEILLPKMDQFIDEIDWDNNTLHVSAPDGLIEMYLGLEEE